MRLFIAEFVQISQKGIYYLRAIIFICIGFREIDANNSQRLASNYHSIFSILELMRETAS